MPRAAALALALAACTSVGYEDIACERDEQCPALWRCGSENRCVAGRPDRADAGGDAGADAGPGDAGPDAGPDPCATDHGGCDPLASCAVVSGEVECTCPADRDGDGTSCVPIERENLRWPVPAESRPASDWELGADTARDTLTGLEWERDGGTDKPPHADALAHCEALVKGGHDDWHLPTRAELTSLVDYGQIQPAWNPGVFGGPPSYYWTATPKAGDPARVWLVWFDDGSARTTARTDVWYVRCVRVTASRAAVPATRFGTEGESVRDRRTALVWQRTVETAPRSQAAAAQYCAGLSLAGSEAWRLPTVTELGSLVDLRRSPAVDEEFPPPADYPATPWGFFWSSTLFASSAGASAWNVDLGVGTLGRSSTGTLYRVRCVR